MARPRRPSAEHLTKAPPAAEEVLDRTAVVEEGVAPESIFAQAAAPSSLLVKGGSLLAQAAPAASLLVQVPETATGDGGKGGPPPTLLGRLANRFHPRPGGLPNGRKLVRRTFMIPPPMTVPEPTVGYWISLCEFLNSFENNGYKVPLFGPGDWLDFTEAAMSQGHDCVANDGAYYDDSALHVENEDGWCEEHYLGANYMTSMNAVLGPCDSVLHEAGTFFTTDGVALMRKLRTVALERVRTLIEVVRDPELIFKMAGIAFDEMPDDPEAAIVRAVEAGPTDQGLAAAYADFMIRSLPSAFGADGIALEEVWEYIESEWYLAEDPDEVVVFHYLRPGPKHNGELAGPYLITRSHYFSTLTRDDQAARCGFLGWLVHWMAPCSTSGRIVPKAVFDEQLLGTAADEEG